jgi:hypothetical protein
MNIYEYKDAVNHDLIRIISKLDNYAYKSVLLHEFLDSNTIYGTILTYPINGCRELTLPEIVAYRLQGILKQEDLSK